MTKSKLAKSISLLLTAGALTTAGANNAFASATFYNTNKPIDGSYAPNQFTDESFLGTDGWTKSDNGGNSGTVLPWLGTAGGLRPFGYVGKMPLNWAAQITAAGDSLEISQADATKYGTNWGPYNESLVNIDTAKGAWYDGHQGWGHNTDIGLFKSDVNALVTLNLTSLFNDSEFDKSWSNFGVTVFTGMDTGNAGYSHHYGWNCPTCVTPPQPFTKSNPGGSDGVIYDGSIGVSIPNQAYSANVDNFTGFTFLAQAGQVYSIYLGGNSGDGQFDPHAGYKLNITTAPVPLPGAVWLFGSALAGLVGLRRRHSQIA